MGIKDLFEKPQQILTSADAESTTKDKVESLDYLDAVMRAKEEFVPHIDFSSASNFAIYGSAEKYYEDAVTTIYRQYPYDGTAREVQEFNLNLNYLTKHVLESLYPRTTGYITLGKSATYSGLSGSYGSPAANEYIEFFGGPHTASNIQTSLEGMANRPLHETFEYSNQLSSDPYTKAGFQKDSSKKGTQLSNLRFNPADGMTVEFWLKKDAFDSTKTKREVIFDLWNGKDDDDIAYGRLLLELSSSATDPFRLTMVSGSGSPVQAGYQSATRIARDTSISSGITSEKITGGDWNHYAVSIANKGANKTAVKFYINGDLDTTTLLTGQINEVTGGLRAHLGALTHPNRQHGGAKGHGLLSASLDEFRYWKEARSSEQIGRYWWTQVRGGSNREVYNSSLGVYYKFNEGVVQTDATDLTAYAIDKKVLDYSGRVSNGNWVGYPGYPEGARSTDSALNRTGSAEFKDPIIYNSHPKVKALLAELKSSGSIWDDQNNASMLNAVPTFMREQDEASGDGTLTNVLQMMGSYFDKIYHLVDALPKIRATSYLTASAKPYPFATHLLESVGMNAPQMFVNANVLESISARDEDRKYEKDISEIKNLIYQNIYNNLVYVYKSKGTEKSIRNIIRCFGVDEELIRLNMYANNMTYELQDNARTKTVKKKYINFNDVDKFDCVIYQYPDPNNSNTVGYITGSGPTTVTASLGHEDVLGMTVETEVLFPIKLTQRDSGFFTTDFEEASLFGLHTPLSDASLLTISRPNYANFQVTAIRPQRESKHVYFKLTSEDPGNGFSAPIPELTSSLFTEVYDNQRWNLSVRVKPSKPLKNLVSGSHALASDKYEVHFYGVNMETGYKEHSFHLSASIAGHEARNFLRASKRLYAGAHRDNFVGDVKNYTDVKVSSIRYWATFLENSELDAHASDAENYGVSDPFENLTLYDKQLGGIHVPRIDTLALHWTFGNVTSASSDAASPTLSDSYFYADDVSSGSVEAVSAARYGWLSNIVHKQHSAKGDLFLPPESGDKNPVDVNYISSARRQLPEVISSNDAVQILTQDDDKYTREHRIVEHYYALEKSMYQTISEEMINMFASVVDFNNLIGEPVNRYRQEYKDLSKLRQLFFERVGEVSTLDRYINFYKWIDNAVTTVIQQLIPASAEVSEELHNMVESHVLERNKYWTKYPTIEFKQDDPEAGVHGVHELTYNWKFGHAPVDNSAQSNNALYWRERAHRASGSLSSGNTNTDQDREDLRIKINQHREAKGKMLANEDNTTYTGRVYALKRFTKPYRFTVDIPRELRSGTNFTRNRNVQVAKTALAYGAPLTISSSTNRPGLPGLPTGVMFVDGDTLGQFKDINDNLELRRKRFHDGTVILAREQEYDGRQAVPTSTIAKILPGNVVSSSVISGYNKVFSGVNTPGFVTGTAITNIHHDFYGEDREIPLQGPFVAKYVGGHQSRHVRLNPGTDTSHNRPEAWKLLIGKRDSTEAFRNTKTSGAFGFVSPDYPYPNMGKNPSPATAVFTAAGSHPKAGSKLRLTDGVNTATFEYWDDDMTGDHDTALTAAEQLLSASHIAVDMAGQTGLAGSALRTAKLNSMANAINESTIAMNATVDGNDITITNTRYGHSTSKGPNIYGIKGNTEISSSYETVYDYRMTSGLRIDEVSARTLAPGHAANGYSAGIGFEDQSDSIADIFDTGASGWGEFTMTGWFYLHDGSVGEARTNLHRTLLTLGPYSVLGNNLAISIINNKLHLRVDQGTIDAHRMAYTTNSAIVTGSDWYHIGVAWNHHSTRNTQTTKEVENVPRMYVNGTLVEGDYKDYDGSVYVGTGSLPSFNTITKSDGANNRTLVGTVGCMISSAAKFMSASHLAGDVIGDLALWNAKLTAAEITEAYSGQGHKRLLPGAQNLFNHSKYKSNYSDSALKAWWGFGDATKPNADNELYDDVTSICGTRGAPGAADAKEFCYNGVYGSGAGLRLIAWEYQGTSFGGDNPHPGTHFYQETQNTTDASLPAGVGAIGALYGNRPLKKYGGGEWYDAAGQPFASTGGPSSFSGGEDPVILNYHAPRATMYREEVVKRPVNIRNILQTTASVDIALSGTLQHGPIGNYGRNYEVVHTSPRSVNDLQFRKALGAEAGPAWNPPTEVDAMYFRKPMQRPVTGSFDPARPLKSTLSDPRFWDNATSQRDGTELGVNPRNLNTHQRDFEALADRQKNKTVIVTKFSAPGGFETMTAGYMDSNHGEYAANNVTTFRNRYVRGLGQHVLTSGSMEGRTYSGQLTASSGVDGTALRRLVVESKENGYGMDDAYVYPAEDGVPVHRFQHATREQLAGTYRVSDIHDEPFGLRTHLARYTAKFGRDSALVYDPLATGTSGSTQEPAGYHKIHRNRTAVNDFYEHYTTYHGPKSTYSMHFNDDSTGLEAESVDDKKLLSINPSWPVDMSKPWSFSAWVKQSAAQSGARALFSLGENQCKFSISIDAAGRFRVHMYNDDQTGSEFADFYCSAPVTSGGWDHVVITYDPTKAETSQSDVPKFYVNGQPGKFANSDTFPSAPFALTCLNERSYIGARFDNVEQKVKTLVDTEIAELAFYDRILDSDEVRRLWGYPNVLGGTGGTVNLSGSITPASDKLKVWIRFGDHADGPDKGVSGGSAYPTGPTGAPYFYDVMGNVNYDLAGTKADATAGTPYADGLEPAQWENAARNIHTYSKYQHDNFYVRHQLPRNHSNYSWVRAALPASHVPQGLPTASNFYSELMITASEIGSILRDGENAPGNISVNALGRLYGVNKDNVNNADTGYGGGMDAGFAAIHKYKSSLILNDMVGMNSNIVTKVDWDNSLEGYTADEVVAATVKHAWEVGANADQNNKSAYSPYFNEAAIGIWNRFGTGYKHPGHRTSSPYEFFGKQGAYGLSALANYDPGAHLIGHKATNDHAGANASRHLQAMVLNGVLLHRQGPYGWPSWKQIRGAQHPLVRYERKHSRMSYVLEDAPEKHLSSSQQGHMVVRPKYGKPHKWTRVTPLTTKYSPLTITLGISTTMRNRFGKNNTVTLPVDISTTYGNALVYFNRDEINKELNLSRATVESYEEVKSMYTRGALESDVSPVTEIQKLQYSEVVFPSHLNMYMGDVRKKTGYTNNFWQRGHVNRISNTARTIHNRIDYGISFHDNQYGHQKLATLGRGIGMSIWPLDDASSSAGPLDSIHCPDGTWATEEDLKYRACWASFLHPDAATGRGAGELQNRWTYLIKNDDGRYHYHNGRGDNKVKTNPEAGPLYAMPQFCAATSSIASPTANPLVGVSNANILTGSGQEIAGVKITQQSGDRGLYQSSEWRHGTANDGGTENVRNKYITPLNKNANWAGYAPIFGGFAKFQTGELAGKITSDTVVITREDGVVISRETVPQVREFVSSPTNPWHDSYEEFYNDIRVKAKDYAVLPEFRMEDHIENWIMSQNSDFLAEQDSLFRMIGMPSGSNGHNAANSSEENFYKIYATSDFLKHFDVIKTDMSEHFEPSALTLQCKAVLKFNPYDGFYPAQRTVQLAEAFSGSYGKHVQYSGNGILATGQPKLWDSSSWSSGDWDYHTAEVANANERMAFRNFLTPLFAPGIMYNTIKAGVACDWPIFTDASKLYKVRLGKSNYWGLGFPSPQEDGELIGRFESVYGEQVSPDTKKMLYGLQGRSVINYGPYKIREQYRKQAIELSIVPASASIGGLTTGTGFTGIKTTDAGGAGGASRTYYKPGYYTTKINVNEIPGLAASSITMAFDDGGGDSGEGDDQEDGDGIMTRIMRRIDITASFGPGPNLGRWDKRIPFEALVNPENYLKDTDLYDYTPHPSASLDVTASWDGQGNDVYSLMANNFLAAIPELYLAGGGFTTIASKPQDDLSLYAQAGKTYGMRLKMYRSLNRFRNYKTERSLALSSASYEVPQDPRDDHGLHETFTMYSRHSAFGYPVWGRTHTIVNNLAQTAALRAARGLKTGVSQDPTTTAYETAMALTASYKFEDVNGDNVKGKLGAIFSPINSSHAPTPGLNNTKAGFQNEYSRHGTKQQNRVLFHTSSFLATPAGALDSVEGYYWSYTPPYAHGEAWVDMIFAPQQSRTYTLAEIVDSLETVPYRVDPGFQFPTGASGQMNPRFIPNGYHSQSLYSAENINANAMQLDSCLNMFSLGKVKSFAYGNIGRRGGTGARTTKRTVGDSPAWIIQPKFETPMLNFNSLTNEQGGTCPRPLTDDLLDLPAYGSGSTPRGMWHQFGTLPVDDEGIWLEAGDIPAKWLANNPIVEHDYRYSTHSARTSGSVAAYKRMNAQYEMESLADLVGMDTSPKRLGKVQETVTISEAVVAVPFIEKDNQRNFFTIDPHMVDIVMGEESYRLSDESDSPGRSIENLVEKMEKYLFPPVFDFVQNRSVTPVAMYVFEFSMAFDKDDLAHMWQNVLPPKASGFEMSTATVNHNLLKNELMGYSNNEAAVTLQNKVQWLVFKVKQRAPTNYYDKVIKSSPELDRLDKIARSRQVSLGGQADASYSYNWPYDHCSIVEMAQIEASVEYSNMPENVATAQRIDGQGGRRGKQGQYIGPSLPGQTFPGSMNPAAAGSYVGTSVATVADSDILGSEGAGTAPSTFVAKWGDGLVQKQAQKHPSALTKDLTVREFGGSPFVGTNVAEKEASKVSRDFSSTAAMPSALQGATGDMIRDFAKGGTTGPIVMGGQEDEYSFGKTGVSTTSFNPSTFDNTMSSMASTIATAATAQSFATTAGASSVAPGFTQTTAAATSLVQPVTTTTVSTAYSFSFKYF